MVRILEAAARVALTLYIILFGVLLMGPFQGLEQSFGLSDQQAHVIIFYLYTNMALLSFSNHSRSKIILIVITTAAISEVLQLFTNRSATLTDFACDCLGVFMAIAPLFVVDFRRLRRSGRV